MAQSAISSPQAVCLGPDGTVEWAKNPDVLDLTIMSVTKSLTAYYVLQSGAFPDLSVTRPMASGPTTPSATALARGDVVSVTDELHAMMLPSDNSAATDLALWSIGQTHVSWLGAKFLPEMRAWLSARFGWTGFTLSTPSGLDTNIFSARMVAELAAAIYTDQPGLRQIMGKTGVTLDVGGSNARAVTLTHTLAPDVAVFESTGGTWRGGKSGSGSGTYALNLLWDDPDGGRHAIGIIGVPSGTARRNDVATIIGDVVGATTPPPDPDPGPDPPGEPSGLFRTSGDPVTLALTNGDPVTIT